MHGVCLHGAFLAIRGAVLTALETGRVFFSDWCCYNKVAMRIMWYFKCLMLVFGVFAVVRQA